MRRTWFNITLLLQLSYPFLTSAATLSPYLLLTSNTKPFSNGSHRSVQCLARSNATYPVYDSPLELAMTFGHRPILSWQVTTFLEYVLIAIRPNAELHPDGYLPNGYYYYHEIRQLGAVSVIPSFFRNFTWSNLYLVLHALAEYIVTAPHAYEMCVEINFRKGGLAGVIFLDWWTPDVPTLPSSLRVRDAGNRHLLEWGP